MTGDPPPVASADTRVSGSSGVQFGDHNTQVNALLDASELPSPTAVDAAVMDNLPVASSVFVGRDAAALADVLHAAETASGVVIGQAAVHGLGGIGKTELALHFARTYRDRFRLVWWVTADTAENVGLGLAGLTRRLHPVVGLADAREWALGWLQTHDRWLLVLDNVEDVADVAPVLGQVAGRGAVLVTTRRNLGSARWARLGLSPLRLDVLDREASVDLLTRLAGPADRDGAGRLAEELGDLPLALEQAAAYVSQHAGVSFDGYRDLLRDRFTRIAGDPGEGGAAERAVAGIWQVTMAAITKRSPLAGGVLGVLAWLAPDLLPEDVLLPLAEDDLNLEEALALLDSYHMVTREGGAVSVHRLVQAVVRDSTPAPAASGGTDSAGRAVALLAAAIPDDPIANVAGWPRWNALLPHIDAVTARLGPGRGNTDLLHLGDRAATYRQFQGQLQPAITLFEQVLTDSRRLLGDDHPDTLTFRHNLAYAYREAGQVAEAISLYEQILADRVRVFGDDHPHTLASRHNLAGAYREAGRVAEAITLFEQVYTDSRRVLGDDHPDTTSTEALLRSTRAQA